MARTIKQIFIGIGTLFCLVVVLLVGVLFYLKTDHARRLIQSKVNKAIPGTISFEGFRFSLLKGEFEVRNALLKGPSDDELAGFDRFFIDLSWTPLLDGDLTIAALVVEKPWTTLRVDSQGQVNLLRAFPAPKPRQHMPKQEQEEEKRGSIPINIVVRDFKLVQGHIRYEMVGKDLEAVAQAIDLTADGDLSHRSGKLSFRVGKGRFHSPKIRGELDELTLEAMLKKGRIDPLVLKARTNSSKLALSGNICDVFTKPFLDVALALSVSLPEVRESLHLSPTLTGRVGAHLAARGSPNNPEMAFHLDYGGGILSGIQIDHADLDWELKDRFLDLKNLHMNLASGELDLRGEVDLQNAFVGGFLAPKRDLEAISYRLLVKQRNIKLRRLLMRPNQLRGTVNSDLSVQGKGISPQTLSAEVALALSVEQLTASQAPAPIDCSLEAEGNLTRGVATVKRLEAKAGDIILQTDGQFDRSSEEVVGKLTLEAPSLTRTLSSLGIEDVSGAFGLSANVSGPIKRATLDLALHGDKLRFQETTVGDVRFHATLHPSGTVRISQLALENQGSSVRGAGSIQILRDSWKLDPALPMNLSLALRHVEPRDFLKSGLAQGSIDGGLKLHGSLKALEAALSLRGKDLGFKAVRFGDLEAELRFSQGKLYVDELGLRNQNSRLRISGNGQILEQEKMQLVKDPTFLVDIEAAALSLEDFVDKLKGEFSLTARLEGRLTKPKGMVTVHGKDLDLGVQKLQEVKLLSKLDGEKIWMSPLVVVVAPGEILECTGWFSLQKSYQIALVSTGISLHNIDRICEQKITEGSLLLDIVGTGTLEDPHIKGDIALHHLRLNGSPMDDVNIHLDLHDQLARISGKLDFDFNGSFHLQKRDFAVSILFDQTDLTPYLRIAGQAHLSGMLSGQIEAKGNAAAMDQLHGSVNFSRLDLFFKEKELARARDLQFSYTDEQSFVGAARLLLLKEGWIDVKGKGKRGGPVALEVEGRIPLQVLRMFLKDLPDMNGDVVLSAAIGGTLSQPDIQATVGLEKVSLTVPGLLQKLHDLNGRIQITPQAAIVHRMEGQLDTGRFDLAGKIDLDGLQPTKVLMTLKANGLPIQVPDTLHVLVNAELKIHGTPESSMIEGEAVILEGTYYKDVNLSLLQVVRQKKREEAPPPSEITQPFLRNMSFDISIKQRNPFVVDNNLAHLDINPDLRISGKLSNPIIRGRASVESGTITYRKRTFVANKGVIDFLNPYKTEPTFLIEGEAHLRRWTIFLEISGTPDQLTVKLTSDPPEEEGDILSLLLLGRTTRELIHAEGGTSQSTAQMLAGLIAATSGEDIKKATGLDMLEVETQEQQNEEASDRIKVTVGKELSRRMTAKYRVESKEGDITQRAIAEYKFLEHILLSGFQDDRGIFGGGLKFRLEFR
jgi:autotransporter translocation and assembly factor TamB